MCRIDYSSFSISVTITLTYEANVMKPKQLTKTIQKRDRSPDGTSDKTSASGAEDAGFKPELIKSPTLTTLKCRPWRKPRRWATLTRNNNRKGVKRV